jgi:hypothetical protein
VDEHIFEFDYLKRYLDTVKYFHEVAFERWNVWLGAEPEFGLMIAEPSPNIASFESLTPQVSLFGIMKVSSPKVSILSFKRE